MGKTKKQLLLSGIIELDNGLGVETRAFDSSYRAPSETAVFDAITNLQLTCFASKGGSCRVTGLETAHGAQGTCSTRWDG